MRRTAPRRHADANLTIACGVRRHAAAGCRCKYGNICCATGALIDAGRGIACSNGQAHQAMHYEAGRTPDEDVHSPMFTWAVRHP